MMGDNRDNSADSRVWKFLDISEIRGKAFIVHWSWKGNSFGVRFGRVGKLL
jgi:signal peptidase I